MAKSKIIRNSSIPRKLDSILLNAFWELSSPKLCNVLAVREQIRYARNLLRNCHYIDYIVPDEDSELHNSLTSFAGEASDDLPF